MTNGSSNKEKSAGGLSSARREDIWALIIAGVVMLVSLAAPDGVYHFFKKVLYIF